MKFARFSVGGKTRFGIFEGGVISELDGNLLEPGKPTGASYSADEVRLLAPVLPGKIICIGFNYKKHVEEMKDIATKTPTLTLKAPNTVIGCRDPIVLPKNSSQVEHEAELGIIIGKAGYRIKDPKAHILGYVAVNDVTARDVERSLTQWSASKSFPSFCPIGPFIETVLDPDDLEIICRVNGKLRQRARTSSMIFGPMKIIEFVSSFMCLEPGDLICTGTVPGVGLLKGGDIVEVGVEGVGNLENPVVLE